MEAQRIREGCLLCLELKDVIDSITIDSNQWHELNIKNVLDNYLWPMNHIQTNSYICTICWRELYEFHKFYIRIEEAHISSGLFIKNIEVEKIDANIENSLINEISEMPINELENCPVDELEEDTFDELEENIVDELEENPVNELEENPVDEYNVYLNEHDCTDNNLHSALTIEEHKPLIKDKLCEEPLNNNNLLVQKRKRGRPRKGSCNGTNTTEAAPNTKIYRKRKLKKICDTNESTNSPNQMETSAESKVRETIKSDVENSEIKQETNLIPVSEEHHTSNDSDSDNEIKSSIDTNCPPKTIRNEKDKFLAENFKITCYLCCIPIQTFYHLLKHFKEHHKEPGHVICCNKKYYRRSIFVDHVHFHLNPNYFKCNQCDQALVDRRSLRFHLKTHEINSGKNHCCDICGKGFLTFGILNKHRLIHLSDDEKNFSCSECGKKFASNYMLATHHRITHLRKYVKICEVCGKSIRCKEDFERHMLQHEGKTIPSPCCDICGLVLTDNKALKRHKDVMHPAGGQHEYTCSICSKISPNLRAHKMHVQYKHVMDFKHKCTICGKAFKRAPTLKEHMASHTGTTLYTCPWCPKTFNSNANMHNHRKRVHPKEWEEASRKRYSGNLPPNYKPPTITEPADFNIPLGI